MRKDHADPSRQLKATCVRSHRLVVRLARRFLEHRILDRVMTSRLTSIVAPSLNSLVLLIVLGTNKPV
jgi:hypothetical protein